jgi:YrbI family 3-deoxy-D-manno-octulosonate 8-phosphate phosphatase
MKDTKNLIEKLKNIKLLVLDVDGTLTNSQVYYSKNGEELKAFSIRDGMGIELWHRAGFQCAILTSESSPIVEARAKKLKFEYIVLGSRNKKQDLEDLSVKSGIKLAEIAYVGDDVNDLQALEIAGVSACPADSVDIVCDIVDYVCKNNGGGGAVRELIDLILKSQEKATTLPTNW